jgi:L,D-transpeptidase catalytic domain
VSPRPSLRVPTLLALVGAVCGCSNGARETTPVPPPNPRAEQGRPQSEPRQAESPPAEPPQTVPAKATVTRPVADRIYSKARFAWILAEAHPSNGWLGYLGLGGSVAVRGGSLEKARVPNAAGRGGCKEWYAVEPTGYVCAGDSATVDPKDPVVVALAADAPRTDSPWPYDYGESLGAPRYAHAPTPQEQRHDEWDFDEHEALVTRARAGEAVDKLAGVDLSPATPGRWGVVPDPAELRELSPLVREARPRIAAGSTVAYTRSFELGGRTFLITHDHAIVPRDRVKPYPRSEFHGVELGREVSLPLAFFRGEARPKYRRGPDGTFAPTGESWPRLAFVGLTGDEAKDGKRTFLATREPETWVLDSDAAVVRTEKPPAMALATPGGRKTWLDVSILGGTLVAYEGDVPVFATLISPGRGGVPEGGRDPLETASTPTGTFRVDGKFVTATMVSSTNDLLVHTEVQYVQNFHGPHALHAAYWHDGWGEKKSGGCVNLAPTDAKRLFGWTEPRVPEDWYGMRSAQEMGPATVVVMHR